MRPWLLAGALALAGCSWTFDDQNWLPLRGSPRALDGLPHLSIGSWSRFDQVYVGPDGRVWVVDRDPLTDAHSLRSLEAAERRVEVPFGATVTVEGVTTAEPLETPPTTRFRARLDRLGAGPDITAELTMVEPSTTLPVGRAPGHFFAAELADRWLLHIVTDDGSTDTLDTGDGGWNPQGELSSSRSLYMSAPRNDVSVEAVYGLAQRQLHVVTQPGEQFHDELHDLVHDRLWRCTDRGLALIATDSGARRDLGVPACGRLMFDRPNLGSNYLPALTLLLTEADSGLMQAVDGTVYAIDATGKSERLGSIGRGQARAWRGRSLLYYLDDIYAGYVDGKRVIEHGIGPAFASDGKKLYWLEGATSDDVGDLLSYDLGSGAVRNLVRNVIQFGELPDGRLVAVANAAVSGHWNRMVLVDEARGESRWLADDVQSFVVVGDQVVAARENGTRFDLYLIDVR